MPPTIKRFFASAQNDVEFVHGLVTKFTPAFTLAEVLITLGIIGVVAAMTIPNLIANYQKKQTVIRLKGAYAQLIQAIKLSEYDNGEVTGWDYTKRNFFELYLQNYIKGNVAKFKRRDDIESIPYKEISGKRETGLDLVRWAYGESYIYTLLNGVDIISAGGGFIIDINGARTKPNQFGKDAFYFMMPESNDRRLVPMGFATTSECKVPAGGPTREYLKNSSCLNYGCNKNGRGMFCGALIMLDDWQIRNDYPW